MCSSSLYFFHNQVFSLLFSHFFISLHILNNYSVGIFSLGVCFISSLSTEILSSLFHYFLNHLSLIIFFVLKSFHLRDIEVLGVLISSPHLPLRFLYSFLSASFDGDNDGGGHKEGDKLMVGMVM